MSATTLRDNRQELGLRAQPLKVLASRLDELPVPRTTLSGRVRFDRVGFHYSGPLIVPVLAEVSLAVEPGSTVAIVGRSGAGKTTLVKCLAGLLEPTSGVIEHDGVDLRMLEYRSLRRQIGVVLQDNHLFDETIARNIAFGEDEPDPDRVEWAARIANADAFVQQLPLGYATRIGETGMRLSGGQRQRVAIARAIYHDPPCWCSTRPPARSTPSRSGRCSTTSRRCCGAAPRSWSHTASAPCATPTSSWCSNRAGWWSGARTTS